MSSELPAASGRSVFSVFGFGSSHYPQDDDFSSPLETAPESFDASNSLTALTKKKKKMPFSEEVMTTLSLETAPQVCDTLPDQSELVLQSLCQSNKKPGLAHHSSAHTTVVRRYSTAQEEADDATSSSQVLSKFSNTLTQTAYMLTKAGGSSTNIYNSVNKDGVCDSPTSTSHTASIPALTRVKSSPHLSVMPNFGSSPPHRESLLGSNLISQYIRRHQSQNDLLEVVEYKPADEGETPSSGSLVNLTQTVSPATTSDTTKFHEDLPDIPSSGYNILSRTRQFGAWLTQATEGERVEVTKKDLNVLAPNSF